MIAGARLRRIRAIGLAIALAWLLWPGTALASHGQIAILQDDTALDQNPAATLAQLRDLGVQMVRIEVRWSLIAPNPDSRSRPRFDASNPSAYPAGSWNTLDTIDRDARIDGIKLMFLPTAFAPLWAQGSNPGRYGAHNDNHAQAFEPSARDFGQFVRALGTRYSGDYDPTLGRAAAGSPSDLPRVSTWELYNEPNFGEDLAPQAIDGSRLLWAPVMYRELLNAAWVALAGTGHSADAILIGALAAHGASRTGTRALPQGLPGNYGETKPLSFIRELYCLDSSYREYRGAAAARRHCPTHAAASRRFRAQNPALFRATGFSEHPYPGNRPPNSAGTSDPNQIEFSEIPRLYAALDRIQRIYGSAKRFPIWNTEYGYITDPPNRGRPANTRLGAHYVSPPAAAYYLNWAEYLSWRNPRIVSTMQYLLYDPNPAAGTPEYGGFASGLTYYATVRGGVPKPSFYAYRVPIFLPSTSTRRGRKLELWGGVRPSHYAALDTRLPQTAQIQFAAASDTSYRTLESVAIRDAQGYFDVHISPPSSGWLRIAYTTTDPALGSGNGGSDTNSLGTTIYSRSERVTIR